MSEDEDELYWPDKLSANAVPRRGGVAVKAQRIKPADRALILERLDGPVRELLERPPPPDFPDRHSDRELVAAGRAELDGGSSPLGAAVVGTLTAGQLMWAEKGALPALAELWLETGGPVFAARAVVESAGIEMVEWSSGPGPTLRRAGAPRPPFAYIETSWHGLAKWVRVRLAELPEAATREVVAVLAGYRDGPLMQRIITSYLVPEQAAWVDEDCAALAGTEGAFQEARMLAASITRADQLALVDGERIYEANFFERTVATLLDGLGAAVGPQVEAWLDQPKQSLQSQRLLLSVLAGLPTDEAFAALVRRHKDRATPPYLSTAMGRYPARALRLLAADGPAPLLRDHVLGHRELAEELLPGLPDVDANRIRRILAAAAATEPAAPVEALPAALASPAWTVPPALPDWVDPEVLPPVRLRDGRGRLPADAVLNLVRMLAEPAGEAWPAVRAALDPGDLAELGWALFQHWRTAGLPARQGWAFEALARTGDDSTVRRLSPVILAWPGESRHARAVAGLDILATIGSELALVHLHRIAEKAKFPGLKERATEKVAGIAKALGLEPEQLADRLVPDFGLEPDGSLALDYGPRRFTVGFDEQLKPFVHDEQGKRLKELPKPGAKDDAALARTAYAHFTGLKKDVRAVAGDVIRRLERAMLSRRRWTGAEFTRLFVEHPLVWHVTRRLVWSTGTPFRVAEDRTFADRDDNRYDLAGEATVGLLHPAELDAGDLDAWVQVFADYGILQPFAQLGREVHRLTGEESEASRLVRYEKIEVADQHLVRLEYRGWQRTGALTHTTPGGLVVRVEFEPGIQEDYTITAVRLHRPDGAPARFGELDRVTASELLRQLERTLRAQS